MSFPTHAIDPDGKTRAILVDADGKLVTDLNPKPPVTYPVTQKSLRTDETGNLEIA